MGGSGGVLSGPIHGTVGTHATQERTRALVAPATADEFNVIGLDLIPVACLSLNDILFHFDSSFVTSDAQKIVGQLPALRKRLANPKGDQPPLGVFGHADPVGDDEYNKTLSGRRAKAVFGLLTNDAALWLQLYETPFGGDDWKAKGALGQMRAALGEGPGRPAAAVIPDYLALVCPAPVTKTDFLGQGADAGGKGDFQGCSEFNLLKILSKSENADLSKSQRDSENLANRRVVIFLFRPGTKVNPGLWPCPRASEGTAGCRLRFFPDSKQRLAPGDIRREHKEPQPDVDDPTVDLDTFACRFYDRIARLSPCERLLRNYQLRLFDRAARPLPFAPFVVIREGSAQPGRAGDDAVVTIHDLIVPAKVTVQWSRPLPGDDPDSPPPDPAGPFDFQLNITVDIPAAKDDDATALERLNNLGYKSGDSVTADDIAQFQSDYADQLPPTAVAGQLDDATKQVLQNVYNSANPNVKKAEADFEADNGTQSDSNS